MFKNQSNHLGLKVKRYWGTTRRLISDTQGNYFIWGCHDIMQNHQVLRKITPKMWPVMDQHKLNDKGSLFQLSLSVGHMMRAAEHMHVKSWQDNPPPPHTHCVSFYRACIQTAPFIISVQLSFPTTHAHTWRHLLIFSSAWEKGKQHSWPMAPPSLFSCSPLARCYPFLLSPRSVTSRQSSVLLLPLLVPCLFI